MCNLKCANYLLITSESLVTNKICGECKMKDSSNIKELLYINKKIKEDRDEMLQVR